MKSWKTELMSCGEVLTEVRIRRGISQGDSLSPLVFVMSLIPLTMVLRNAKAGYQFNGGEKINHLLYMDDLRLYAKNEQQLVSLVQTVRTFSEDTGMQFGIDKFALLIIKSGKRTACEGISLPDNLVIKSLEEDGSYKYLGILEADHWKKMEVTNI